VKADVNFLTMSDIIFSTFPKTNKPKDFALRTIEVFKAKMTTISTVLLAKGLESNDVLAIVRPDLIELGFDIEKSKRRDDKIHRPVFYGENGNPTVSYQIDAFHSDWKCGLEIEAGRAWKGNAVYRDLIQSLVMVELQHLILAVPKTYKYNSNGKKLISKDYEYTRDLLDTLYGHDRFKLPYDATLIGY
jgi:hypothetical protein